MRCMLNEVDPLPTALGPKVKPLNFKPLTDEEIKALQVHAFEHSHRYDFKLAVDTAALDRCGFATYWI